MREIEPKNWYRDEYLVSTDRGLIQIDQVNAAFSSDLMWWAQSLPPESLRQVLDNSLCFGLYVLPQSTSEIAGQRGPKQIGLVRVVTDNVTLAYLTDVYVLPEYQSKGLGRWMMECLNEVIKAWPHLRRFLFLTGDAMEFYRQTLGAKQWNEDGLSKVQIGVVEGPAAHHPPGPST